MSWNGQYGRHGREAYHVKSWSWQASSPQLRISVTSSSWKTISTSKWSSTKVYQAEMRSRLYHKVFFFVNRPMLKVKVIGTFVFSNSYSLNLQYCICKIQCQIRRQQFRNKTLKKRTSIFNSPSTSAGSMKNSFCEYHIFYVHACGRPNLQN